MGVFDLWFRSPEQQKMDIDNFYKWAYPFGEKQEQIIDEIITNYIDNEEKAMAKYNYFTARQEFQKTKGEDIKESIRVLKKQIIGKGKKNICKYLALASVDLKIQEDLKYPSLEELNAIAKQFEELLG